VVDGEDDGVGFDVADVAGDVADVAAADVF